MASFLVVPVHTPLPISSMELHFHFHFLNPLGQQEELCVQNEEFTAGAARSIRTSPFTLFEGTKTFHMYFILLQ